MSNADRLTTVYSSISLSPRLPSEDLDLHLLCKWYALTNALLYSFQLIFNQYTNIVHIYGVPCDILTCVYCEMFKLG